MKPGKLTVEGIALLSGKGAEGREGKPRDIYREGLQDCACCTYYRESFMAEERRAIALQLKLQRLSCLWLMTVGNRVSQIMPGTTKAWAWAYEKVTGVPVSQAQAWYAEFRASKDALNPPGAQP